MKRLFTLLCIAMLALVSCEKPQPDPEIPIEKPDPGKTDPENPDDKPDPEKPDPEKPEPQGTMKPVLVWVDADANYKRLATKEGVTDILDKMVEAGVTGFVVDVKPCSGYCLWDSEILDPLLQYNGFSAERDYDYLQFFIDEGHKRNLQVLVSNTIMAWGYSTSQTGRIFDVPELGQYTCIEWTPTGLRDMKDDRTLSVTFVNPASDYVHDMIISSVKELATKYAFDGFVMDYCRYNDIRSDFSELSKEKFEAYAGLKVQNFPQDIFSYDSNGNIVPGPHYKKWFEWRSSIIHDYVAEISSTVKSVRPQAEVHLWAASWYTSRYEVGQNWASPDRNLTQSYGWATKDYYLTGFADHLDVFQLGAYLSKVGPVTEEGTIAAAINQGEYLLHKNCKMYGTFSDANKKYPDVAEAVDYCLCNTDGVMIFDLCYVEGNRHWTKLAEGIASAKKSGGAYIKE